MQDYGSHDQPIVFRLNQRQGLIVEKSLPDSAPQWPLTLPDCQAMLLRLLPQLKLERAGYQDYWRWVLVTRTEMSRLYEGHRASCRLRREWDLRALWGLRIRLEVITLRLYCAPWLPGEAPVLGLSQFSRLTA